MFLANENTFVSIRHPHQKVKELQDSYIGSFI